MAVLESAWDGLMSLFSSGEVQHQAVTGHGGLAGYAAGRGLQECKWQEIGPKMADHLPSEQAAMVRTLLSTGAQTGVVEGARNVNIGQGGMVNVGGHMLPPPPPPAAPVEQHLAYSTLVYNTVTDNRAFTTNNVDDHHVNNVLNQTAIGGSNYGASGEGAVAAGSISDSAIASGSHSVAGAGTSDVTAATGVDATAGHTSGGGDVIGHSGGPVIEKSNLAGVAFGEGSHATGAAPGGVAVGDGGTLAVDSSVAQGGGVAAGHDIGTAATGGSQVQQVDASHHTTDVNIAGGDQAVGGNVVDHGQMAGGDAQIAGHDAQLAGHDAQLAGHDAGGGDQMTPTDVGGAGATPDAHQPADPTDPMP
jgi:hypothetical protein